MFYDKFERLCDIKGVSVTKATEEIGLARTIGTKWKKTAATPRGDTIKKIAAYFGVSESYLLQDEEIQPIENTNELRDEIRDSYAYRVLFDTLDGATQSDLLEAAAVIQRRKEERQSQ